MLFILNDVIISYTKQKDVEMMDKKMENDEMKKYFADRNERIMNGEYCETNEYYIRSLVSFIRQLEKKPIGLEKKLSELDKFVKGEYNDLEIFKGIGLESENFLTRAEANEILFNYTNHIMKLKLNK